MVFILGTISLLFSIYFLSLVPASVNIYIIYIRAHMCILSFCTLRFIWFSNEIGKKKKGKRTKYGTDLAPQINEKKKKKRTR